VKASPHMPITAELHATSTFLLTKINSACASSSSRQTRHRSIEDMQRPYSNIPPAHSPPLHHPVPQHVSTVPQLRSPPPPASSQSQHGGYGYAPQSQQQGAMGGNYGHPAFGGFMNDPTAQMGFQVGKSALDAGQQYMEQNVCQISPEDLGLCITTSGLTTTDMLFFDRSTAMSTCPP